MVWSRPNLNSSETKIEDEHIVRYTHMPVHSTLFQVSNRGLNRREKFMEYSQLDLEHCIRYTVVQ